MAELTGQGAVMPVPEAHSISFAYLVYVSSYLKFYYPAAFTTALLNNQPMGFYSSGTLINDARHHDVGGRVESLQLRDQIPHVHEKAGDPTGCG